MTRDDVVKAARGHLRTPWHHQGRTPGVGLDCAGLLICVGRGLGMVAPDFDVPAYPRVPDGHTMIEWCDRYMRRVPQDQMQPGDAIAVIVDRDPQHLGILSPYRHGGLAIIHAVYDRGVVETRLMFSRALRFVAAYSFPGIR